MSRARFLAMASLLTLVAAAVAADPAAAQQFLGRRADSATSASPPVPFRNCFLEPIRPGLGCFRLGEPLEGPEFGLNEFGQETTGKRRCLEQLRAAGGDSFVYAVGRCELFLCQSRDSLRNCAGFPAEVTPGFSLWNIWSGRFLAVNPDGGIWAADLLPGATSKFQVLNNTDGTIALRTGAGLFVALNSDRSVTCIADRSSAAARLSLVRQPDGALSVQSASGRWLRANIDGLVEAGDSPVGDPARFWSVDELASAEAAKRETVRIFRRVTNGSCVGSGMLSINSQATCQQAAIRLGITDTAVKNVTEAERPEGCYVLNGQSLWMSINNASRGKGTETSTRGLRREPICMSEGLLTSTNASVHSSLCNYEEPTGGFRGTERRSPVFVQLWEWSYDDIARECEEFLGPAGIDAVQVSPVVEHMLGFQWWVKYQTVSMALVGRAGNTSQFQRMVATCRKVGVQVMVDVVLNQMALCSSGNGTSMPCVGWNGTRYGNRGTTGARGWDAADPSYFHHLSENIMWNCGYGAPTYSCAPALMPYCQPCDMYGLPDWDTGSPAVQTVMVRHLEELHNMGVTMLRLDAAMHISPQEFASMLNGFPWDFVVQEWFTDAPQEDRTRLVGHYRDIGYRWKIMGFLSIQDISRFENALSITGGTASIAPEIAVYLMTYHDGRSQTADQSMPTYKNGLEYHQQQKFMLAWPVGVSVVLFSGYGYSDLDVGPPGCEAGMTTCRPSSVFNNVGQPLCLPTPKESPLPDANSTRRGWVCEHRWEGVAGLVGFRKACLGLPVTATWTPTKADLKYRTSKGRIAFQIGTDCFAAMVRGMNTVKKPWWGHVGSWPLAGLTTGLLPGRYCDVASLSTLQGWSRRSCPREVTIGAGGVVVNGTVPEGDLLAIHAGARLSA